MSEGLALRDSSRRRRDVGPSMTLHVGLQLQPVSTQHFRQSRKRRGFLFGNLAVFVFFLISFTGWGQDESVTGQSAGAEVVEGVQSTSRLALHTSASST